MDVAGRNKRHFDALYATSDVRSMAAKIRNLDRFLGQIVETDLGWHGLYRDGLRERLRGLRVLELGAGDGLNALAMAALGAEVVAVDISEWTPVLIRQVASELGLAGRVTACAGEFPAMDGLSPRTFDLVVGKWFLHHLDHAEEACHLRRVAAVLKPGGEARFIEPATNSAFLERLGYLFPNRGRPSSLQRGAFRAWRGADRHPARDNSSLHFREAAGKEFGSVEIVYLGSLEGLLRLLPKGERQQAYRKAALRREGMLPAFVRYRFARAQIIDCRQPRTT